MYRRDHLSLPYTPAEQELEHHASGWWATVDAGTFNTDMQVPDRQVGSKFASQFNVTGQSGIGTSLFNICEFDA